MYSNEQLWGPEVFFKQFTKVQSIVIPLTIRQKMISSTIFLSDRSTEKSSLKIWLNNGIWDNGNFPKSSTFLLSYNKLEMSSTI